MKMSMKTAARRTKTLNKRKELFTKLLCFVCLIGLCLGAISCKDPAPIDRSYDAQEVEAAAAELLEKSLLLCDIYYGAGIPISKDDGAYSVGRYAEADREYLAEHGIDSIATLRFMTYRVFSEAHGELLFSTAFAAVKDGDVPVSVARYFEQSATAEHGYRLMVDTLANVYYTDTYTYDLSTIRATHAEGERVYFDVSVTVTDGERTQTRTQSLCLIEEEGGWRLDVMPGATYSEYFDIVQE